MNENETIQPRPRFAPSYCCGPYPEPAPQPPRPHKPKCWCPCPRPKPCQCQRPCNPCGACEPPCYAGTTRKVLIPSVLGDDSEGSNFGPKNGLYFNSIVEYEANGAVYIYSGDGVYTRIKDGKSE